MKKTNRKVDEQLRVEISNILMFEVSDPRLNFVSITSCYVSYDRAYADVYFTTSPDDYESCELALNSAKGHIRSVMSKKLEWKKTPELRFHLDDTIDNATRIENCIEQEHRHFDHVSSGEDNVE